MAGLDKLAGVLLGLTAIAAPPAFALADPAPPPLPAQVTTAASLAPSNSVHCVYDQLSTDDREMALLLFEREVMAGVKLHSGSRNLKVIDRLVDEARAKCSQPYAWSSGRTEAAIAYAMNELMSEGVSQALEAKDHGTAQIEDYYAKHRGELAGLTDIDGSRADAFRSYLFDQGWAKGETSTLGIGEFYLESLLTRDHQAQSFAAAAVHPLALTSQPKPRRPPSRAKSARRGKP